MSAEVVLDQSIEPPDGSSGTAPGGVQRSAASRFVNRIGGGVVQIVLALIAVCWLVPSVGLLVASFRPEADNSATGWWTVVTKPAQITISNYQSLLANSTITHAFWNTILITVPATLLVVIIASLAAYAFAWMDFPGRDWLFILVVGLLVVPVQVALIPVAELFGLTGIFGSRISVIMFHVAFGLPFAVFLLRNFFAGIPRDLLEAARMDGGTEWTIFRKVILPLGLPAIASLAIFQFIWVWNDLLIALVYASPDAAPLTVALQSQIRQFGANIDILSSGAFLSLIVPLIVFFSFQRYFVQGMMAGSVK